jgi:hypothetical protein
MRTTELSAAARRLLKDMRVELSTSSHPHAKVEADEVFTS